MVLHLFEPAENPRVSWMCLNDCERRRVNIPNIMSFFHELLPNGRNNPKIAMATWIKLDKIHRDVLLKMWIIMGL
jgi:hypothetical protein